MNKPEDNAEHRQMTRGQTPAFLRSLNRPPAKYAVQPKLKAPSSRATASNIAPAADAGHPLPEQARSFFEQRLGHDFRGVRIHADRRSGQQALNLAARAFTYGRDIYFAPGEYRPDTAAGQRVLAHELTHVVQQRNGRLSSGTQAAGYARLEAESDRAAQAIARSERQIRVQERAQPGQVQADTMEALAALGALAGQGIDAVAEYLLSYPEAADPKIQELNALRGQLAASSLITLTPAQVAMLEALYRDARDAAPFWLSIPDLDFSGTPVQRLAQVAPIAGGGAAITLAPWVIAALIVILIVIFLLQLIFYFEIPQRIAEGADTLVREVQRAREETTQPPAPSPEPEPEQKGPTDVFPPVDERPPLREEDDTCDTLPISWPEELPDPYEALGGIVDLIRTSSSERDLQGLGGRGTPQRHLNDEIVAARNANDPPPQSCFDNPDPYQFYDAHHIHPLFLAGTDVPDNLCAVETRRHLRGHKRLQYQPEWIDTYRACGETTDNLYRHQNLNHYVIVDTK